MRIACVPKTIADVTACTPPELETEFVSARLDGGRAGLEHNYGCALHGAVVNLVPPAQGSRWGCVREYTATVSGVRHSAAPRKCVCAAATALGMQPSVKDCRLLCGPSGKKYRQSYAVSVEVRERWGTSGPGTMHCPASTLRRGSSLHVAAPESRALCHRLSLPSPWRFSW